MDIYGLATHVVDIKTLGLKMNLHARLQIV